MAVYVCGWGGFPLPIVGWSGVEWSGATEAIKHFIDWSRLARNYV